jgi:hypothetical protein
MGSYGMLQYLLPFSISVCTYLSLSIFSPMFCTLFTSVLYCSLLYFRLYLRSVFMQLHIIPDIHIYMLSLFIFVWFASKIK